MLDQNDSAARLSTARLSTELRSTELRSTELVYRRMDTGDLAAAHGLTQAVRWPHRVEDWQFVLRVGSGYVAEQDGAVIGTGLCWKQGPHHASLGMIIVSNEHQGKGIGRELMRLVMEELGERCILLNATAAGQPLYERMGFVAIGTLCQHQGVMAAMPAVTLAGGTRVRPGTPQDLPAVIVLANRASGMGRDALVHELAAIGDLAVLERDGALLGFSILRPFGRGRVIGPLVAPDPEAAKALVAHWSGACAGSFVRIDIDEATGLGPWLEQVGLAKVDTAVIMACNGVPERDAALTQFAIINQALC